MFRVCENRVLKKIIWAGVVVTFFCFGKPAALMAHEPLFSLGPHTLFKGGIGIEWEAEVLSSSKLLEDGKTISDPENQKASRAAFPFEWSYGLTRNLSVTAKIPIVRRKMEKTINGSRKTVSSNGLSDISFRTKYRFWKRDSLGVQQSAAVVFGIKLPTGDEKAALPLGTGSTDWLLGLTAGHEGRRLYAFGDLRYRLNTKANDLRVGDVFFYDVALGFRPILSEYDQPDLVLVMELNGEVARRDDEDGSLVSDSGGHTVWLGPNFLLSYRNIMSKGGIRFPIVQKLNGIQLGHDYEAVFAIELHL